MALSWNWVLITMRNNIIFLTLCSTFLLSYPVQAACEAISDGVYVSDNNANLTGKEGQRSNVLESLKRSDPKWAATTLEFSLAFIKRNDQLLFSRTIGNSLDEQYETLSVRAQSSLSAACNSRWSFQVTQYYRDYINFFGKPRGKARKLPEPVRINLILQAIEQNAVRVTDCQSEVREGGRWRAYSEYDSVDLCSHLKLRKLFNIRPDISGKKEWQGYFNEL